VLLKQVDFNPATAGFRRPGLGVELHDAHHLPTHPSFPPSGFEHTTQCSFLHYHFTTISPFPLFEGFRSLHPTLLRRDLDSLSLASSVYLLHRLIRKRSILRPPPPPNKDEPLADHVPSAPAPPKWSCDRSSLQYVCVAPVPRHFSVPTSILAFTLPPPPDFLLSFSGSTSASRLRLSCGFCGSLSDSQPKHVPFLALTEYTPNPPPLLTSLPLRTLPFSSSFSVLVGGVGVRLGYHGWPPLVGPR